jgi:hypothetical protein
MKVLKRLWDRRSSLALLLALTLVAVLLVFWYYLSQDPDYRSDFRFEIAKYLVQLILIALLGGVLVQQYGRERDIAEQQYNRQRDKAEAVNEFRKDILSGLTRAYNDTKKVRRILKASTVLKEEGSRKTYEISCTKYEEQIQKLMDPQLEYEFYKKQLDASDGVFTNTKEVRKQLEELEGYLNYIIDEYDSKNGAYKKLKNQYSSSVPTKKLKMLDNFLSGDGFKEGFANKFDDTAKLIRQAILTNRPQPADMASGKPS